MRPRYSFSSRHTRRARDKFSSQSKAKFPELLRKIISNSDIIIQVLDARFPEETRNKEVEKEIENQGKKIIYVLNKSDLLSKKKKQKFSPYVYLSARQRRGSRDLRDKIKIASKKIKKPLEENKINIGIIGYPNTGKSSLINLLVGKSSAGTGAEAGYTKGLQKIKLTEDILLIDSPGVIPQKEYSSVKKEALAKHTKVGGRSYSQVKDPELVVSELMKEFRGIFEKYYKIKSKNNSEILLEELGRKKSFLKKGNEVDTDKTARLILKNWQEGKIKV